MTAPTKEAIDEAWRVLRSEYYSDVRGYATELAREHIDPMTREPKDQEALYTALHELCDGSNPWTIYTFKAKSVALLSENADAYEEEMGEAPATPEAGAYFALMADINDLLANEYFLDDVFGEHTK